MTDGLEASQTRACFFDGTIGVEIRMTSSPEMSSHSLILEKVIQETLGVVGQIQKRRSE
jgi:hypothetical protein